MKKALLVVIFLGSFLWAHSAEGQVNGTVVGNGAWSWFGDPRSVYGKGLIFTGWVTSDGLVQVSQIDSERRITLATIDSIGHDDHNNPSMLIRRDGRITAFYAAHRTAFVKASRRHVIYFRTTQQPYDIRRWGSVQKVKSKGPPLSGSSDRGLAYPNPIQMRSGPVWLFWRGGNWWPWFSYTKDWRHWSRPRNVVRGIPGQRPYVKVCGDGKNAYLAFTEAHPRSWPTSIYFLKISQEGNIFREDGTKIGTVNRPPRYSSADTIYKYSPENGRSWTLDVAIGLDGQPVVLYYRRQVLGGDTFRYARWDGQQWVDRPIVSAGISRFFPGWYHGGGTLDHEDPRMVYLSRRADLSSKLEIEKWATADHGETWRSEAVTQNSKDDNWRPVSPRGHPGSPVLWFTGTYVTFIDYHTNVMIAARPNAQLPK
jgi:hypothetical protein